MFKNTSLAALLTPAMLLIRMRGHTIRDGKWICDISWAIVDWVHLYKCRERVQSFLLHSVNRGIFRVILISSPLALPNRLLGSPAIITHLPLQGTILASDVDVLQCVTRSSSTHTLSGHFTLGTGVSEDRSRQRKFPQQNQTSKLNMISAF